ncbi:MAG: sigma-70 family RNA polymerase sigma factor [Verrucomicrobia bacterium]|nr:sigma-70 family RNA polymerase sigma factor [Verrucomicrobiota bacterium]
MAEHEPDNFDGANQQDVAAMARLAAGDDLALNELMQRWQHRIVEFIHRMTADHETAVDLAQETFVRVHQNRSRYQPQSKFSTWLFTIATNLARNHARWRSRHPEVALSDQEANAPPDHSPTPDANAISNERAEAVRAAIDQLPDDLKEALVLSIYEEMPQAEIAAVMGCSIKAVELRIYRARQMLKDTLQSLGSRS